MSYVPNPSDPTEPVASRTVESAAREFREIKGLLARSLSFPAADAPTNRGLLPPAADRAGRVLHFNATTGVPETGATVSSLMAAESNAAASAASAANSAATATAAAIAAGTSAANAATSAVAAAASSPISATSVGSPSALATTVRNLAEFRADGQPVIGAIVLYAPTAANLIMHQLEVSIMSYNRDILRLSIQGYRFTDNQFFSTLKSSFGTQDVITRFATTADGRTCIIFGDANTQWGFPHLTVPFAQFSHNTPPAYLTGWTVGLLTSFAGLTNLTVAENKSAFLNSNLATSSRNVMQFIPESEWAGIRQRTYTYDATLAVQAAIDFCVQNNLNLYVPYMLRVSQLFVDRMVDAPTSTHTFTLYGEGSGGFYTTSPLPIFSTRLVYNPPLNHPTWDPPISQRICWDGINFEAATPQLNCFALDVGRFLRVRLTNCMFNKIRLGEAAPRSYMQSYVLSDIRADLWAGVFCRAAQAFDFTAVRGLYQPSVTGTICYDISGLSGGTFDGTWVNCSEVAIRLNAPNGVNIRGYFEHNNIDLDFRAQGGRAVGVHIHGSAFLAQTPPNHFTVLWGDAEGCTSTGNVHWTSMHSLQANSFVTINDVAGVAVSNNPHITNPSSLNSHRYQEGTAHNLLVTTNLPSNLTVSTVGVRWSKIGNQVQVFGLFQIANTNLANAGAARISIAGNLPFPVNSAFLGQLMGSVDCEGSNTNGVAPSAILATATQTGIATKTTIPPSGIGDSWTVRLQLNYVAGVV